MNVFIPPRLRKGDKVGIISPSNTIQHRKEEFFAAVKAFSERLEVEIVLGSHTLGRQYYSSGTTEDRITDFHKMLQDTSIKAIVFSTGGHTAIDLVSVVI